VRELAQLVLDKQVRMGRPIRISGLAEATGGPAFAVAAGLITYAHRVAAEQPRATRAHGDASSGLFGRLGNWLRENF
jgi:cell division protein FtsA